MSLGISACLNPWESFLSANNAQTKNILINSYPDFIFCGLFLCPLSLGRPEKVSQGTFLDTLKTIFLSSKNRLFFPRGRSFYVPKDLGVS